jgi:hypothetical protein
MTGSSNWSDSGFTGHELKLNSIWFKLQHPQMVEHMGVRPHWGYRIDLPIENALTP